MTLCLVEKVDALYLLAIALLPHMDKFLVVAHETPDVRVVENVFHVTTCRVTFVTCCKLVAELQGFWHSLTENVRLWPQQDAELLFLLADYSQLTNVLILDGTGVGSDRSGLLHLGIAFKLHFKSS